MIREESAISLFRKLPETKSQVSEYKNLIRSSVEEGEVNPLVFLKQVTALEQLTKELKGDVVIKDIILEEAERYNKKSFDDFGANFQIKEVGTKYDFSVCNDAVWEELEQKSKAIAEAKRERENFLKTIRNGNEVFGADGVQLEAPQKSSTTQVVITLNK